ncbi:7-cyano-7-deazaguanine synthase [Bacillus phage SP-15]|uniref:7-cyano-7-deazaguanine synthase n=1 Tax=Bacillus phage SP-15 TaxID=1792032 RepID=A0A127AWF2_9CAUD|nr:QueC-like queuosine biosynthesis [Bacillus phage SP-15]AMM44912.1 7-cyano-7-deazaguanine synthase [Bacillus phage SP-15]
MIGIYDTVKEDKNHYVIWSGGCDSTLLLYEVASKYGTKEKPIKTISFESQFLQSNKVKTERYRRTRLLMEFKKRGLHIQNTTVVTSDKGEKYYPQQKGLAQAFLWVTQSLIYVGSDNLYFGYIKGDDFWQSYSDFYYACEYLGRLLGHEPNLCIPFRYDKKSTILNELHEHDLYDLTWYCELPDEINQPCGRCNPCSTHLKALFELAHIKDKDWAKKLLDDKVSILEKLRAKDKTINGKKVVIDI